MTLWLAFRFKAIDLPPPYMIPEAVISPTLGGKNRDYRDFRIRNLLSIPTTIFYPPGNPSPKSAHPRNPGSPYPPILAIPVLTPACAEVRATDREEYTDQAEKIRVLLPIRGSPPYLPSPSRKSGHNIVLTWPWSLPSRAKDMPLSYGTIFFSNLGR